MAGPLDTCFGNTVITTSANGAATRWYFDADGKVVAVFPDGARRSGRWTLDGLTLATTFDGDAAASYRQVADGGLKVGQTISALDPDGGSISVALVQGR